MQMGFSLTRYTDRFIKSFIVRMIQKLLVIFIDRCDFVYNNIALSQSFVKPISGLMGTLISVRQE